MNSARRIRTGILGCSDIARRRFLPALARSTGAELTAVASRDRKKARAFASPASCRAVSYEELLRDPGTDLVYVSLPNHLHEEWTLRALDAGKHVICEKPLGLTLDSVRRMAARAREKGLLLYENVMYLHHPQHHRVRELIEAGTIGSVRSLRTAFGFRLEATDGFRSRPDQGGGSFHDLARYPLSAALFFLRGGGYRFRGYSRFQGSLNVGVSACGITSEGENFFCSIGFDQQYECWYEIVGDRGRLRVDRAFTTPADLANTIEIAAGQEKSSIVMPPADHFREMIEYVCGLILEGRPFSRCWEKAEELALLADQLEKSCEKVSVQE